MQEYTRHTGKGILVAAPLPASSVLQCFSVMQYDKQVAWEPA
jgi:hypothetical protein